MLGSTKSAWLPRPEALGIRVTVILVALSLAAGVAEAQESQAPAASSIRNSWPYVVVGLGSSPCSSSQLLHAAIGAERILSGGFGLGGEIGGIAETDLSYCGAGVVSFNALYHFSRRSAPGWSPFVTGGASLLVAEGGGAGGNVAVGIVRFVNRRVGLRLEARAHWFPNENGFTEARVGVSF